MKHIGDIKMPFKKKNTANIRSLFAVVFEAICVIGIFLATTASAAYEKPPTLDVNNVLIPEMVKGKYHTVETEVINDGIWNHYRVQSPFGIFKAPSTSSLHILIAEIEAIGAMKQVETDDTAISSIEQTGHKTVSGVKQLVTEPKETLQGAASGVSSLFNRAANTVGKRKITDSEGSRLEQIVGYSKAKGQIATKYVVDVYSHNSALQDELDRLAQADYLGGLGVGVATSFIPGVGGLVLTTSGTARLLNEAINTTPASELWLQNKEKLLLMGVNEDVATLFLNNPVFSPALQTVQVAALESLNGVGNREVFITVSLQASDYEMAKIITLTAVMTAGYHKHISPLKKISPVARITKAETKTGKTVVLLPADHIIWSRQASDFFNAITAEEAQPKRGKVELWVLGDFSKLARKEMETRGGELHTHAQKRLVPKGK